MLLAGRLGYVQLAEAVGSYLQGRDVLVIARSHDTCRELSRRVRDDLVHLGLVYDTRTAELRDAPAPAPVTSSWPGGTTTSCRRLLTPSGRLANLTARLPWRGPALPSLHSSTGSAGAGQQSTQREPAYRCAKRRVWCSDERTLVPLEVSGCA